MKLWLLRRTFPTPLGSHATYLIRAKTRVEARALADETENPYNDDHAFLDPLYTTCALIDPQGIEEEPTIVFAERWYG